MNKPKDTAFIYGIRAVLEAISAGQQIDKVLIQSGLQGPLVGELRKTIKASNIPAQNVPINKLNFLTRNNHQGVVAFLSPVLFQEIDQLIPMLFENGKTPFILALDKVTDVRNFGAICRTAECTGVDAILVSSKGAAAMNADAVKSSAGALLRIPVCRASSLPQCITFPEGKWITGHSQYGKNGYPNVRWRFFQSNGDCNGVGRKRDFKRDLEMADQQLKIPLKGELHSLNVSVAAGVVLYEALRQKSLNE